MQNGPVRPPTAPGSDRGATAVEYGMLAAAVAGVLVVALTALVHVLGARIDCVTGVVQGSGHSSSGSTTCDPGTPGAPPDDPPGAPPADPGPPSSTPTPSTTPTPTPTPSPTETPTETPTPTSP